jgi:hypothetical protein
MGWNYDSWLKNYNKRMDRWFGVEKVRTRDKKGRYLADDKTTPNKNEAWTKRKVKSSKK